MAVGSCRRLDFLRDTFCTWDADRRQGPPGAHAADQPLVAGSVREPARIDDGAIPYGAAMSTWSSTSSPMSSRSVWSDGSEHCAVAAPPDQWPSSAWKPFSTLDSLGHCAPQIVAIQVDPAIPVHRRLSACRYRPMQHMLLAELVQAHRVILDFRASFPGKVSPVHFFWGAWEVACAISGAHVPSPRRRTTKLPRLGDRRGLSSAAGGFWPGGGEEGGFYSYAYPEPQGFPDTALNPMLPTTATSSSNSCAL